MNVEVHLDQNWVCIKSDHKMKQIEKIEQNGKSYYIWFPRVT